MTREEAIKKLQKQKAEYLEEWVDYSGVAEAYDMAIEALSAELVLQTPQTYGKSINPSNAEVVEDLISRADAIEAIASRDETDGTVKVFTGRQVNQILSALPSAEAVQGEWKRAEINGYQYAVCDQCHLLADMVEKDGKLVMSMANADDEYANFCPNCGARMKGGAE